MLECRILFALCKQSMSDQKAKALLWCVEGLRCFNNISVISSHRRRSCLISEIIMEGLGSKLGRIAPQAKLTTCTIVAPILFSKIMTEAKCSVYQCLPNHNGPKGENNDHPWYNSCTILDSIIIKIINECLEEKVIWSGCIFDRGHTSKATCLPNNTKELNRNDLGF